VNQANSVTTLSLPPTTGPGLATTLTATVAAQAPGYGSPTGVVTFYDGTTSLGTGTLTTATGTNRVITATLNLATGLGVGVHQLSAVYGGDVDFLTSTSATVTVNVAALTTYTALASSANPVVVGQSVTYTATVYTSTNASGTPATGSVVFYDGSAVVATVSLTSPAGSSTVSAQYTTTYTTSGSHAMTAVYVGDSSHSSSTSSVLTETVNSKKATSHVYVSSSANPSVAGASVVFTMTVNPGATGTLTLSEGNVALASGAPDSTGKFTFTTSTLAVGAHLLTAAYSGDANFLPSTSAVFTQNVLAAATVTLLSSANPAIVGQAVTLSGTVTATTIGGVSAIPTGTVTLYDGSTNLTPTPLALDSTGAFSLTLSTLAAGTHQITVRYSGDKVYAAGYASLAQVVNNVQSPSGAIKAVFANWFANS
jgi:hypothetical protein